MLRNGTIAAAGMLAMTMLLAACGGGAGGAGTEEGRIGGAMVSRPPPLPSPTPAPAWLNVGRDAQHSGLGGDVAAQPLSRIVWRTEVDLAPRYRDDIFLDTGHYGSPLITSRNTAIVPVKTTAEGRFRLEARDGRDGTLKWQSDTDFVPLESYLSYNIAATPEGRVYYPGLGGKLYYRDNIDGVPDAVQTVLFYGPELYAANQAAIDANVVINTPLTTDAEGTVWFGFTVRNASPGGLAGGVVRVDAAGKAVWAGAAAATGDERVSKLANSAAPALSPDGRTLYAVMTSVGSNASGTSYLVSFDSSTLAVRNKVLLLDPETGGPANISGGTTASPVVGPDGDVYYAVSGGRNGSHTTRGWVLHFDAGLVLKKGAGGFGIDVTPTVIPAASVGAYHGSSSYLLAVKFNSYSDSQHRMAVLDPNATENDRLNPSVQVMKEVIAIMSPTLLPGDDGFRSEWCVNMAAFDPRTKSLFINNSDGYLYRWDLASNTLAERLNLNSGYYQFYTPTALGPDGKVYAINNALLMVVGN